MTPLLTKWRERREEFKDKFVQKLAPTGIEAVQCDYESIESFLRQSLIAIIEGEIKRLEWELELFKKTTSGVTGSVLLYVKGVVAVIQDQISYYQSTLEGLKKL